MATHGSATARPNTSQLNLTIKQRAQALIGDPAIDAGVRAVLRYAVAINDLLLPALVRRVGDGECIIDESGFLKLSD